MNIGSSSIRAAAEFMEAYANTCIGEVNSILHPTPSTQRSSFASVASMLRTVLSMDDDNLQEESTFASLVDAASAYREAGQHWMYLDARRSCRDLWTSGTLFWRLGFPFGLYLHAVCGSSSNRTVSSLGEALNVMSQMYNGSEPSESQLTLALRHPQQQAYLLVAAASTQRVALEHRELIQQVVAKSPHKSGVAPVGALGVPIRTYWSIAEALLRHGETAPRHLTELLVEICRRYQEAMQLGQVNRYLWDHVSAPVNVGDVDAIGLASISARTFGRATMAKEFEHARTSGLSNVGIAPLDVGMEFAAMELDLSNDLDTEQDFGPTL